MNQQSVRLFIPRDGSQGITIKEVVEWHWARCPKSTVAQVEVLRRRVLGLFTAEFGDRIAEDLIADEILSFIDAQPKVKAGWTRKQWAGMIGRPFNAAVRLGIISRSPMTGLKFPRGARGRDLTPTELKCLLRAATPAFRRVLLFLRWTGLRPGELKILEWSKHIRLVGQPAIVIRIHKTSKTQAEPKPRTVPLCGRTLRLLLWLKRQSTGPFVFENTYGTQWKTRALCKNLKSIRDRIGLTDDVKIYGCRHSFGTGAVLNGVDPLTLAELMGHTNTQTTSWYVHLSGKTEHLEAAMEKAMR